ncbi:degenerin unc-8 [Eupeodes corollae]|uniref:degenerin unc-8 n=1 Tax=Eupeodes corollae TaxID=290404 RepID=UPI0024903449|nr:degenerin unc-8 [Eupeodes corollae]
MSGYWKELRIWILRDPKKLIRYIVLFICSIIVIVQLYECFSKLRNPPISTHSYFNLNDTIEMPAVTVCREPPYKENVLEELFNDKSCYHPKYTQCWSSFPFEKIPLIDVFVNGTFEQKETFQLCGYNNEDTNVDITSSIHFNLGRCYTVRAKFPSKRVSKNSGYSMMLTHHVLKKESFKYEAEPGWHLFVHDAAEEFTEINMKASGRVEYVFAEIDEEIEIKLQSQHFSTVPTIDNACDSNEGYSDFRCGETCIWREVTNLAGCTGPWMPSVQKESCHNYDSMKNLTVSYQNKYNNEDNPNCECVEPCHSKIFSTYIQNRKPFIQPKPTTQIWIYYTSKLITMIEDRPSYDTTQFIADMGGTLGFLLGLSVLGLIGILEHITLLIFGGIIKKIQLKEEKRLHAEKEEEERRSNTSDTTLDVSSIDKNRF